jgi:hypothetical protein
MIPLMPHRVTAPCWNECIVQPLLDAMNDDGFFFDSGENVDPDVRNRAKDAAATLLQAGSREEKECAALNLIKAALLPNDKGELYGLAALVLDMVEKVRDYPHTTNAAHFVHQANTFLLGLLFYARVDRIRERIDAEMNQKRDGSLSVGTPKGEFLFRWRIASLLHDVGNAVSLHNDDLAKINDIISRFQGIAARLSTEQSTVPPNVTATHPWSPEDAGVDRLLPLARGYNALVLLDQHLHNTNVSTLFYQLRSVPFDKTNKDSPLYYDHGIVSALLILKKLDDLYEQHRDNPFMKTASGWVSCERHFFDGSIVPAAAAVAVHNVNCYEETFVRIWGKKSPFDIMESPFAFLLKVADILQGWDKWKDGISEGESDVSQFIYRVERDKITILGHPNKEKLAKSELGYVRSRGLLDLR